MLGPESEAIRRRPRRQLQLGTSGGDGGLHRMLQMAEHVFVIPSEANAVPLSDVASTGGRDEYRPTGTALFQVSPIG